jgi:hypothetical protein
MAKSSQKRRKKKPRAGKLRIADHWNAISIIANSQSNPLKAVAEFVENSIDAPYLNLTPGTRQGIIRDERFDAFCMTIASVEAYLKQVIEDQRKAEEERSSRRILRKVQRALKEAFLRLPQEEYDWFDIHKGKTPKKKDALFSAASTIQAPRGAQDREAEASQAGQEMDDDAGGQMAFFEFAGPVC